MACSSPGLSNKVMRARRPQRPRQNDPLVSVILCTYDRAGLVERAIRSVLRQTYRRWELVLVDDGSTDGSELALAQLAKSDRRVVLISRANRGLARSRNEGLALARGQFVAFLDSDDEVLPSHLRRHVDAMLRRPELDLLLSTPGVIGPRRAQYVPDVERPGKRIHISRCHSAGSLFAKRSVLIESGGFPHLEFAEDYALITRLKAHYRWGRARMSTYIINCGAPVRMCDIYGRGGAQGLRKFRRGGQRTRRWR